MSDVNVIFFDENETTLHERLLARLVAEALVFKVRIENESEVVKQEKKELLTTKQCEKALLKDKGTLYIYRVFLITKNGKEVRI